MTSSTPIQNIESIDIVGERLDGGIDLVVVASADIDASPVTLRSLEAKLRSYLVEASSEAFRARRAVQDTTPITIVIRGDHFISKEAIALVQQFKDPAAKVGIQLRLEMARRQAD